MNKLLFSFIFLLILSSLVFSQTPQGWMINISFINYSDQDIYSFRIRLPTNNTNLTFSNSSSFNHFLPAYVVLTGSNFVDVVVRVNRSQIQNNTIFAMVGSTPAYNSSAFYYNITNFYQGFLLDECNGSTTRDIVSGNMVGTLQSGVLWENSSNPFRSTKTVQKCAVRVNQGGSKYITISSAPPTPSGGFTYVVISRSVSTGAVHYGFYFHSASLINGLFAFYKTASTSSFISRSGVSHDGGDSVNEGSAWFHKIVSGTYGSSHTYYTNGTQGASRSYGGSYGTGSSAAIGLVDPNAAEALIDEVLVFQKTINSSEAMLLNRSEVFYNASIQANTALLYSKETDYNFSVTNFIFDLNYSNPVYETTNQTYQVFGISGSFSSVFFEYNGTNYSATLSQNNTVATAHIYQELITNRSLLNVTRNLTLWFLLNGSSNWTSYNFSQTILKGFFILPNQQIGLITQNRTIFSSVNITITNLTPTTFVRFFPNLTFNLSNSSGNPINNTTFSFNPSELILPISYNLQNLSTSLAIQDNIRQFNSTMDITNAVLRVYSLPNYCSDYIRDSGLFNLILYNNRTFFFLRNVSLSDSQRENLSNCLNNDAFMFRHLAIVDTPFSTFYTSRIASSYASVNYSQLHFLSPLAFKQNRTLIAPGASYICNSSNSCLGKPASNTFNFTEINETSFIRNGTHNITAFDYKYYFVSIGGGPHFLFSNTPSNYWFNNQSMNYPLFKTFFYSVEMNRDTPPTPLIRNTSEHSYSVFYIPNSDIPTTIVLFEKTSSGFGSVNTRNYTLSNNQSYRAYILTPSGTLITPLLSHSLSTNFFRANHYNVSNRLTILPVNEGEIVVNQADLLCYFIPPFNPTNFSLIYTVTGYLIPDCSVSQIQNLSNITSITYPVIPTRNFCFEQNNSFNIDVRYTTTVNWRLNVIRNYVNVSSIIGSSETIINNISLTNDITKIELLVNNQPRCSWARQTSFFGFQPIPIPELSTAQQNTQLFKSIYLTPFLLFSVALTVLNPFLFVFVLFLNDLFQFLTAFQVAFLGFSAMFISFIVNWRGERALKSSIALTIIILFYIFQLYNIGGITTQRQDQFSNFVNSLTQKLSAIQNSNDMIVTITQVVPLLFIDIIILTLSIPSLIIGILFDTVTLLNANVGSIISIFEPYIIIVAYAFIIIRGYEIARNMFRPI